MIEAKRQVLSVNMAALRRYGKLMPQRSKA
jgi:hypothetical protein